MTSDERRWFDFAAVRHAFRVPSVPLILTLQFVATFCFANFESTLALFTDARWNYDIRANGFIFTYGFGSATTAREHHTEGQQHPALPLRIHRFSIQVRWG